MTRRLRIILGLALAGACLAGMVGVVAADGSVTQHVAARYQPVPADTVPGARPDSRAFRSADPPAATADAIAAAWTPAERLDDPTGVYLRYRDVLVAALPADGGSWITVDRVQQGYARYYPVVGHRWGRRTGFGEGFRGGGPGFGK